MKQDFPEKWELLRSRLGQTKPLLLLGAGASVESGGRTADSIVKELLRRVYGDKHTGELNMQFSDEFGRSATFENVLDELGASGPERRDLLIECFNGLVPSKGYEYLAALLKGGYFYPIVISMNFDTLLEDAVKNDTIVNCNKTMYVFSWPALWLAFVDCLALSAPMLPVSS